MLRLPDHIVVLQEKTPQFLLQVAQALHQAKAELTNLEVEQHEANNAWIETTAEMQRHDSVLVKLLGGEEKFQKITSNLPGPLGEAINGLMGMTGAAKAFIATPLGAVLAALILAWQALNTWFERSEEGQKALAEISGYLSGVMEVLKDVVATVGETLYKAFTNPKEAGRAFVNFLKDQIVNRLKAVGQIGSNVGSILYNAFTFNLDGVKQGVKDLANSVAQFGTGIEKPITKVKNAIVDLNNKAKESAKIAVEEKELQREEARTKKLVAEYDNRAKQLEAKGKRRTEAETKELKALQKKMTDAEMAIVNKKIELQKRAMDNGKYDTIEDQNNLDELYAQREKLLGKEAAKQERIKIGRAHDALPISAGKKAAKERADANAKEIADTLKHNDEMAKLRKEADDAMSAAAIAGIVGEAERERAERKRQHEQTIRDIRAQEDEVYKAIYEQRKKSYENANKGKKYENTEPGAKGWTALKQQANAEVVGITDASGKERTVLVTPVLPDGTVLTKEELNRYVSDALSGAKDIKEADIRKVVLDVDVDKGTEAAVKAIESIRKEIDTIDPSSLDEITKKIGKLNLSGFKKGEQEQIRLELQKEAALIAQNNAEQIRQDKERAKSLIASHQSYTDKKKSIDKQYQDDVNAINEAIAKAAERGDQETVESLKRSLAEAEKDRAKQQADLSLEQLKLDPNYIRAFEDLETTSTETLEHLIAMFEEAKTSAAKNLTPDQLKEYTDTIERMRTEINERNPFKAMAESSKEVTESEKKMKEAHKGVEEAQKRLDAVRSGAFIQSKKEVEVDGMLISGAMDEAEAEEELEKAKDKERKATDENLRARREHSKAVKSATDAIDELGSAISGVGNAIPGMAGQVISLIGDVTSFATQVINAVNFTAKGASAAIKAVESASVILAVVGAALQIIQKITSMFGADYEDYNTLVSQYENLVSVWDDLIDRKKEYINMFLTILLLDI